MRSITRLAAALTAGFVLSPVADAYTLWGPKWAASPTLYISSSQASTYATEWGLIQATASRLTQNAANIGFFVGVDDDTDQTYGNKESEVVFTTSNYWLCGSDACCYRYADSTGKNIAETDVFMNIVAWETTNTTTNMWAYGGGKRPISTVAMHEFGHVLGLSHTNNLYNMMGQAHTHINTNGSNYTVRVGEDATSGLRSLYGSTTGAYEDLEVSHWMYDGVSGEYSTHKRTRLYDSAGTVLTNTGTALVPVYSVTKGSKVKLEATFENNGALAHSGSYKVYLSLDSTITSSDTELLLSTFSLGPDTPYTNTASVTIPSTLSSGTTYYLGISLDTYGAITEVDEANNYAYITAIKIK